MEIDKFYLLLYGGNMNDKNKKYILLIVLVVLIIICNLLLNVKYLVYNLKYDNETFNIKELYKNGSNYIEIKHDDKIYPIRLNTKNRRVINKIYYYKDKNLECIFPVIDNINLDVMCYKEDILYNYFDIKGENKKLDKYIKTIKEYNKDTFLNKEEIKNIKHTITLFNNEDINKNIAITTYKGLMIDGMEIELFKNDIYNNKISSFVDNFYLIADYDKEYEFNDFYLVNIKTKSIEKIKTKYDISFDSYIQGIVDNKIYLYDLDNQNQYEIDVNRKIVKVISSKDKIRYYKSNKWETISKPSKELYFDYIPLSKDFIRYDYVLESDNYYYLFKKNNDEYNLYRVDKENINIYKYIGVVPSIDIHIYDDYLYYISNNKLYYYSDSTSFRTILIDTEFTFNNTIKYYIY